MYACAIIQMVSQIFRSFPTIKGWEFHANPVLNKNTSF